MNPELYERYLAKKAKKLGITVEELKAQGTSSPVSESSVTSSNTEQTISQESQQPAQVEPQYVQRTIQDQLASQENTIPQQQPYMGMQPETVKTEVPSYVFGPSKIQEAPKYNSSPINQNVSRPEIKDNRENKFGLIGYPLGHSLSKVIHEAGFKSLGINATYDILETPPDNLVDRIKWLKGNGYKGFNVTIPLKLPISLFVNEVDNYADLARAVNTVYVEADKSLKAYNTDVIGFRRAIPKDIDLRGKKVAILGTGGAAHAACIALTECGVQEIAFFTRNIPNSIDLMNYVRRKFPAINFNVYQIENIRNLGEYSMLVNTTPIGMLGKAGDMMPVETYALESLNRDAVVYDVIYNPKKTVLIRAAEKLNLRTITGLDMFIYQAVAAQEIWFGNTPDFKDMKIAALEAL
ncbi:shikimate dehydrogenase [Clostridium sp. CAG:768]|nr:shikimate dehydrogenase [Clostridium sp. CAG:768]